MNNNVLLDQLKYFIINNGIKFKSMRQYDFFIKKENRFLICSILFMMNLTEISMKFQYI